MPATVTGRLTTPTRTHKENDEFTLRLIRLLDPAGAHQARTTVVETDITGWFTLTGLYAGIYQIEYNGQVLLKIRVPDSVKARSVSDIVDES
jgi:hypothetical protein